MTIEKLIINYITQKCSPDPSTN